MEEADPPPNLAPAPRVSYLHQLHNQAAAFLQICLQSAAYCRNFAYENRTILGASLPLLVSGILLAYFFFSDAHVCIKGNDIKMCKTAVGVLAVCSFASLTFYIGILCCRTRMIGYMGRVPRWVIAISLILGIFMSNIFSYCDLASILFIFVVMFWSIKMWCLEYVLGHYHTLGLSACGLSMGGSLSVTLLHNGPTIGVVLIYYSLAPSFQLCLRVNENGNDALIIPPQQLLLQVHANQENEGQCNNFMLRDLEASEPVNGHYELVPPPPQEGNFKLYDLIPSWPRG